MRWPNTGAAIRAVAEAAEDAVIEDAPYITEAAGGPRRETRLRAMLLFKEDRSSRWRHRGDTGHRLDNRALASLPKITYFTGVDWLRG